MNQKGGNKGGGNKQGPGQNQNAKGGNSQGQGQGNKGGAGQNQGQQYYQKVGPPQQQHQMNQQPLPVFKQPPAPEAYPAPGSGMRPLTSPETSAIKKAIDFIQKDQHDRALEEMESLLMSNSKHSFISSNLCPSPHDQSQS